MTAIAISGTGLYTPPHSISNEELVTAFNAYVRNTTPNTRRTIAAGKVQALPESSVEFVVKASGIKSRFVVEKDHILDPERDAPAHPRTAERPNLDPRRNGGDRREGGARPRRQEARRHRLRHRAPARTCSAPIPRSRSKCRTRSAARASRFDMNVACSSATFGMQAGGRHDPRRQRARGAGGESGNLLRPSELPRPRQPFHLRRRRDRRRWSKPKDDAPRQARLGDPRHAPEDAILEQHPQQFRLPQPRRARRHRQARQAVRPGRPQGLQGSGADGRRTDP